MVIAANQVPELGYSRYMSINSIDDESLKRAENIFSYYKEHGVIQTGTFGGDEWELCDERNRVRLCFGLSDELFYRNAESWAGCTSDCYRDAAKAYVLFQMGMLSLHSLRNVANTLRQLGESGFDQAVAVRKNAGHAAVFLQLIPGYSTERDAVIESLEENNSVSDRKKGGARELADFKSYFRFHDELDRFWESAAEPAKLFYFPMFLWWNLTAILPLRPTEFLMMPRDCLMCSGDENFITVRRTRLKGGNSRITYSIDGDFEKKLYPVSWKLAKEIKWYQDLTNGMHPSPIGALFRREASSYYEKWDKRAAITLPYGYMNLSFALKVFYREALSGRNDISMIHLGDTRHIAMMNLIISGGSPTVCMELAGHEDIDVSSNYYANMANLVECATYEMYRKGKKGSQVLVQGQREYQFVRSDGFTRVKDGWCRSSRRKGLGVEDCISSVNSLGEMGDCKCCRYFMADIQGVHLDFYDMAKGRENVDADSWFLMHVIEAVRQGIGLQEDIKSAMLRLQQSCMHYRDCLIKSYGKDEEQWQGQEKRMQMN